MCMPLPPLDFFEVVQLGSVVAIRKGKAGLLGQKNFACSTCHGFIGEFIYGSWFAENGFRGHLSFIVALLP